MSDWPEFSEKDAYRDGYYAASFHKEVPENPYVNVEHEEDAERFYKHFCEGFEAGKKLLDK